MTSTMRLAPIVLGVLLLVGCIVEAPGGDRSPEKRRAVVAQVPGAATANGADFGGKVELLAVSIQPAKVGPGDQVKVTAYFKCLEELDQDYLVFVHVEGAENPRERLNLDHKPAAGGYPTRQWKRGETVKDEFSLQLPASWVASKVNVWVGFWEPQSDTRLPLRNPARVTNDGANRVLLAELSR
jgi:hypothetical protein